MSGLFIVLEGIDGAGKSEQTRRLTNALFAEGTNVVALADSQFGSWGAAARAWERTKGGEEDAEFSLGCFVQDRWQLSFAVREIVQSGRHVICDRWEPSTWAYRLAAGMATSTIVRWIDRFPPVIRPDLTLWLRLPPELAFARAHLQHRDLSLGFLRRVDSHYAVIPDLRTVDASRPPAEVTAALRDEVRQLEEARMRARLVS